MAKPVTNEYPLGSIILLAIVVSLVVEVWLADYLLNKHGYEYITDEVREWLKNAVYAPIFGFLFFGLFGALLIHFITHSAKSHT